MSATAPIPGGPPSSTYAFKGSATGLLGLQLIRSIFLLVAMLCVAGCLAAAGSPQAKKIGAIAQLGTHASPIGFGAGALIAVLVYARVAEAIRLYRIRHTYVFGRALDYRPGCLAGIANSLGNLVLALVTLGLAGPWITARNKRHFYKSCVVTGSQGQSLDFRGTGSDVLVYYIVTILSIPFVIVTLGLLLIVIDWLWLQWEQSNLLVPDPSGRLHRTTFSATLGEYFSVRIVGSLLSLLTLGLYRPWALVAEWRWTTHATRVELI